MPYYPLYRATAEIYLMAGALVSPSLCIFGWLLIGKIAGKRLHSYTYWYLPLVIGSCFGAVGVLLQIFIELFAPHDYALATGVYLLYLASAPFHIVSFVRLWKTITKLPPNSGEQPQVEYQKQDEGVWPPPPQR